MFKLLVKLTCKQNKLKKLGMPVKLVHKSLASINKETFFYINFSHIITETKKQK